MVSDNLIFVERELKEEIESKIKRTGLLYRIYSRIKSDDSIREKIKRKNYAQGEKMIQDYIGIRVMTYFGEDIEILINHFSSIFEVVDFEQDKMDINSFSPVRINMVCRLRGEHLKKFNEYKYYHDLKYIDSTFEIQIRTTLSEGWHEIEHNLRYKCKSEWKELEDESRMLNGIHATLITSDQTMAKLFEEIAYQHYKNKNWVAMVRNKFRLQFDMNPLSPEITTLFDKNQQIAKQIYKSNRKAIIYEMIHHDLSMDISFDNIVYLCNYLSVKNKELFKLTPKSLLEKFDLAFQNILRKTPDMSVDLFENDYIC